MRPQGSLFSFRRWEAISRAAHHPEGQVLLGMAITSPYTSLVTWSLLQEDSTPVKNSFLKWSRNQLPRTSAHSSSHLLGLYTDTTNGPSFQTSAQESGDLGPASPSHQS